MTRGRAGFSRKASDFGLLKITLPGNSTGRFVHIFCGNFSSGAIKFSFEFVCAGAIPIRQGDKGR
jgi:hypothetical protein